MTTQNKNTFGTDPLDPWADRGPYFDSNEIRYSKSRKSMLTTRNEKPVKSDNKTPKIKSPLSRIRYTISVFSEREDKKKIITQLLISLICISGSILLLFTVIIPWNNRDQLEKEALTILDSINDYSINETIDENTELEKLMNIKSELSADSTVYGQIVLGIAFTLEREDRIEEALNLLETEIENVTLDKNNRVQFLLRLDRLYESQDNTEQRKKILGQLLEFEEEQDIEVEEGSWPEIRNGIEEEYNEL